MIPKPPDSHISNSHFRDFGPFQFFIFTCRERAIVNVSPATSSVMVDPDAIVELALTFSGATKLQPDPI
jgi:hypothetical protein